MLSPLIGRELIFELRRAGFRTEVRFNDQLHEFDPRSLSLLRELSSGDELRGVFNPFAQGEESIAKFIGNHVLVHLPLWMTVAEP